MLVVLIFLTLKTKVDNITNVASIIGTPCHTFYVPQAPNVNHLYLSFCPKLVYI